MDISNEIRKVKTTDGKQVEFTCSSNYFVPPFTYEEADAFFERFRDTEYCLIYTTINRDKGVRYPEGSFYGVPFDNGNVGYQNAMVFYDEDEAKKIFELLSKLTPKVGVVGYCDVYLIKKVDFSEQQETDTKKHKHINNIGIINK